MTPTIDVDPLETREWLNSLHAVLQHEGESARVLLARPIDRRGSSRGTEYFSYADDTLRQYDFSGARRATQMGSRHRAQNSFDHSLERRRDYSAR